MIKNLTAFIENAIRKYKQERLTATIDNYAGLISVIGERVLPHLVALYRNSATNVVNKTYENPLPTLELVDALQACIKYYGPELAAINSQYTSATDVVMKSERVTTLLIKFTDALMAIKNDTNKVA